MDVGLSQVSTPCLSLCTDRLHLQLTQQTYEEVPPDVLVMTMMGTLLCFMGNSTLMADACE